VSESDEVLLGVILSSTASRGITGVEVLEYSKDIRKINGILEK